MMQFELGVTTQGEPHVRLQAHLPEAVRAAR
jgi:hypothetical protein